MTSSVYNVHLVRQILHRAFELGNETVFQRNELHRFWTGSLRGKTAELYLLEPSWKVLMGFCKKVGFGSCASLVGEGGEQP